MHTRYLCSVMPAFRNVSHRPRCWFRVKVLASEHPFVPPTRPPSISLRLNPSADFVFGCRTPSLSVNIFATLLILDAICSSSSRLSYLCGASQACPMAALLSVYHNSTSVRNKLGSADPAVSFSLPLPLSLHSVGLLTSCNSAHAALWWCPCLCRAVLCLIICV